MYVLSIQYSCAVVSVFLFGRKANLVLLTLFYSTLLTLTDGQTDRQTDRQRNTFASRGLEELFFQLCCCVVSVFGSGGKQVLVYILMYLEYNTVVVLCQFFGCSGKQFLVLCTYLVYNTVVLLCQFFGCSGKQFSK